MKHTKGFRLCSVLCAGIGMLLPQLLVAAGYPVCTNNKITLPGEHGPEVWSCVSSSYNASFSDAIDGRPNTKRDTQSFGNNNATAVSVEKRTQTSSDAMKDEIERVLDNTNESRMSIKRKNFSVGMQYSSNRKDQGLRESRGRSVLVPLSLGVDLTDKTRVSVTVPLINKQSELVGNSGVYNSDALGVGDVSVSATSQVVNETESRPGIALSVGVGAPTGKNEDPRVSSDLSLGSGFWSVSAGATLSKRFDPATMFGSVRYQHIFEDEQFGHEVKPGSSIEFSYGLGFSLNNALSVSGHFAGAIYRNTSVDGSVIEGSNSEPLEFVASSALRLSPTSRLESNLGFGLNKDASDARIGLTLTKDF